VDPDYGGRERLNLSELKPGYKFKKDLPERPILGRLSLHAAGIRLRHPVSGETIAVEAPLPKDFSLALKYLRKYRPL
jgi:23S rRNA pseudouridine1911/1915/1917 synthase